MKVKYGISEIILTKEEAKACEEAMKVFKAISDALDIKDYFSQFGEDCATAYNTVDDMLNNWVDDIEITIEN
ncbi:MAG: hypothetical protein IKN65_06160 [Clostridia bacterium]|nr:hypothetical protein [Clostridia bacterium]